MLTWSERIGAPVERNWGDLKESRRGVMLHYDASSSDLGALTWLFRDKRCAVSYNWLVMDNGERVPHAPWDKRAWHAGACRPSNPSRLFYNDANSAFYGVAVAATNTDVATPLQVQSVVALCLELFTRHRWYREDIHRITGHNAEAWPRGRKDDPDGPLGRVLSVAEVRMEVAKRLNS